MLQLSTELTSSPLQEFTVVVFFIVTYYVILFIFGVLLETLYLTNVKYTRELSGLLSTPLTKLLFLLSILTLTGLPPLGLFAPKMAILSLALSAKPLPAFIGIMLLIFFGWYLYFKTSMFSLVGSFVLPSSNALAGKRMSTVSALVCVSALLLLSVSFFFAMPLYTWCSWLLLAVLC